MTERRLACKWHARRSPQVTTAHVLARRISALGVVSALRAVPAPRAMPAVAARAHAHTHLVDVAISTGLMLWLRRATPALTATPAARAVLRGRRGPVSRLERLYVRNHCRRRAEAPPARRAVPRCGSDCIRQRGHGGRRLERAASVVRLHRPWGRRVRGVGRP